MKLICNHCHHLITRKHVKVNENSAFCTECKTLWQANELLNLSSVAQAASLPWFSNIRVDIHSNGDYVIHGYRSGKTNLLQQLLVIYALTGLLASIFLFISWHLSSWWIAPIGLIFGGVLGFEAYRSSKWKANDVDIVLTPHSITILKKDKAQDVSRDIPLPAVSEVFLKKWEHKGWNPFAGRSTENQLNQMAAQFGEVPVIHTGIEYIAIGENWNIAEKRWLVNFLDLLIKIRKMRDGLRTDVQTA